MNIKNKLPIVVLDSGIGGLTFLKKAVKLYPNENFIYLTDSENSPYGNKSLDSLLKIAKQNIDKINLIKCKCIVIACNTLSTNCFEYVKSLTNVPVIPILPPIPKNNKRTILLCTVRTANSLYVKNNFKFAQILPLPFLAPEIEKNIFNKQKIRLDYDLKGAYGEYGNVILGCTHYELIKDDIKQYFLNATFSSGTKQAIKTLKDTLTQLNLLNNSKQKGNIIFYNDHLNVCKRVFDYIK